MSRTTQSKAQNEANARILRAMVKLPENKVCVDCKRNDPRWASWNLGCFMCIRCSGIHRSMGTHISKVKSIDLDIWTPEQMASIQKWGNGRCNAYWEAHLKPGHIPPEHKIESFIRSKYETRRWAKSGPIPEDPSSLDGGEGASSTAPAQAAVASSSASAAAKPAAKPAPSALDLLGGDPSPAAATTSFTSPSNSRQQASLLDGLDSAPAAASARAAAAASPPQAAAATAKPAAAAPSGGGGGLFDLDWHDGPTSPPTNSTSAAGKPAGGAAAGGPKGKNDILSLFATAKPMVPPGGGVLGSPETSVSPSGGAGAGAFGGLDAFGGLSIGGASNGGSGFGGSGFGATSPAASRPSGGGIPGSNPWASTAAPAPASDPFTTGTSDIWGSSSSSSNPPAKPSQPAAARSALDDLWGDFK